MFYFANHNILRNFSRFNTLLCLSIFFSNPRRQRMRNTIFFCLPRGNCLYFLHNFLIIPKKKMRQCRTQGFYIQRHYIISIHENLTM